MDQEHGLTRTAAIIGSPGYLAPEQALGMVERIGPQTDVFALGAILYRALTGANAFPSRTLASAVYEAAHHDPPRPSALRPGLPADIDSVIALALAKNVEQRYQLSKELAMDLALASDGRLPEEKRARAHTLSTGERGQVSTVTLAEPPASNRPAIHASSASSKAV
jgi:serine/threonine-protein kinase